MSNYEDKREARIARYEARAEAAEKEAAQLCERASKMASIIPLGQPILVGHYSEGSGSSPTRRGMPGGWCLRACPP